MASTFNRRRLAHYDSNPDTGQLWSYMDQTAGAVVADVATTYFNTAYDVLEVGAIIICSMTDGFVITQITAVSKTAKTVTIGEKVTSA